MQMNMQKIVINKCYGGFGLSAAGIQRYAELKGLTLYLEPNSRFPTFGPTYWIKAPDERGEILTGDEWANASQEARKASNAAHEDAVLYSGDIPRDDPALVQVVEELESKANGEFAELAVVEIPCGVKWVVEEYDGSEWIAEKHQTWD